MKINTADNRKNVQSATRPGIGFLGVGWIGMHRLETLLKSKFSEVVSICDPYADDIMSYCEQRNITYSNSLDELLEQDIEGVVVATPSALHTGQVLQALENGKSVFCQKPLACDLYSTAQIIEFAKQKDLLLMIDYSYRYTDALQKIKRHIDNGELGNVFSISASFHNAHRPDKKWYFRKGLSGGGCVMDLGAHLIDMIYWIFPDLMIKNVSAELFTKGTRLSKFEPTVEDFATIQLNFKQEVVTQIQCSWNAHAGGDAAISVEFHGTKGGACFRNVQGSFFDFKAEIFNHTTRQVISMPPDDWGGRAALEWASLLQVNPHYQDETDLYLKTAETIDFIYAVR